MFSYSLIAETVKTKAVIAPATYQTEFDRVSTDTRTVGKGDVFVALTGKTFDGNRFLREAEKRGAGLIIASSLPDDEPFSVPVFLLDTTIAK